MGFVGFMNTGSFAQTGRRAGVVDTFRQVYVV